MFKTTPLENRPEKPDQRVSAALFAALFQALEGCSPERCAAILNVLEAELGAVYDDLSGKLGMLYTSNLNLQDKIQGLWLLYLSFIAYPQGDAQVWIGPDLFSDDAGNHLRLQLPGDLSSVRSTLREDLFILARAVDSAVDVALQQSDSGHLIAILR